MSRRLFTVASVLSLPLFVATVVLWVRSYSHLEGVAWETRRAGKLITFAAWSSEGSWYGQRNVFHVWPGVRPPEPKGWTWQNYEGDEEEEAAPDQREFFYSGISHRWLGFALGTSGSEDDVATTGVAAPYWAAAGCFAIFPIALSLRIAVAYRRRKHQMCLQCGYDLRATPDRCPECGVKKGCQKIPARFQTDPLPRSLVLCGATLAMWLTAQKLDRVRLTTRWTDQTRQVKLSVDAIGWDRDAMRHGHWEFDWNIDKLDPAGAQLDPVRQDLRHAFGPPEQTVRKWSDRLPQWRAAHPTMVMWSRSATADQISFRMAALVFGLLPTAWVIGWGRRYWRNAAERTTGCCPICGYDLRATPDRCPECGHVPERVTA